MHLSREFTAYEEIGHTRWLFRRSWELPFTEMDADDVAAGIDGVDVLVVPAGGINEGLRRLGKAGQRELIRWVNHGGRLVAWRYGAARLAYTLGISKARLRHGAGQHRRSDAEGEHRRRQPAG